MPSVLHFAREMDAEAGGQHDLKAGQEQRRAQEQLEHLEVTIPSPLPFVISLLPLLLSPQAYLPASHLSTFVLLRHHFLKPLPPTSPSYLQASPKDEVEEAREYLAQFATCLEEIELSQVDYSTRIEEFGRITARIDLHKDGRRLVLLVIWEEAQDIQQHQPSGDQEGDQVEAGWRYYDLQLPTPDRTGTSAVWHADVQGALRDLIKHSGVAAADEAQQSAKNGASQEQPPAHVPAPTNDFSEPAEETDPDDDFWAGVEDSDDEGDGKANGHGNKSCDMDNEDDYWASYDSQDSESAIPDESAPAVDSFHDHESPRLAGKQQLDGVSGSDSNGFLAVPPAALPSANQQSAKQPASDVPPPNAAHQNGSNGNNKAEEALRQSLRSLYSLFQLTSNSPSQTTPSEETFLAARFLEIVKEEVQGHP